jgi:hypothetical protein
MLTKWRSYRDWSVWRLAAGHAELHQRIAKHQSGATMVKVYRLIDPIAVPPVSAIHY